MRSYFENKAVGEVRFNELMKYHTTFEVGGPCDVMIIPQKEEEIIEALKIIKANNLAYRIIGNGSNLLVTDKGLREVVIKLHDNFDGVEVVGNTIRARSGEILKSVAAQATAHGLTGFECLSGIPGDIGGAVTMNAGAYGGEIKDILLNCKVIDENLEPVIYSKDEMHMAYRQSRVQTDHLVVLEAVFKLESGNREVIEERVKEFSDKRKSKQPLEYASAGSTFKRPVGHFAGKLIEDAGLRGYRYKNAMVSEKHCGFIINCGGANFEEVYHVIQHVQDEVYRQFQVKLESEVRIIGEK